MCSSNALINTKYERSNVEYMNMIFERVYAMVHWVWYGKFPRVKFVLELYLIQCKFYNLISSLLQLCVPNYMYEQGLCSPLQANIVKE